MTVQENEPTSVFVSLIPLLKGKTGHDLSYHEALECIVQRIGWSFFALIPRSARELVSTRMNWFPCCVDYVDTSQKGVIKRAFTYLVQLVSFGYTVFEGLKLIPNRGKRILFIEQFTISQYLSIAVWGLFFGTRDLSVWVLFRYEHHRMFLGGKLHRVANLLFRFGNANLILLTDSELLSRSLGKYFGEKLYVLPIPHAETTEASSVLDNIIESEANEKLVCWWPGEPRVSKGLEIVRKIINTEKAPISDTVCVVISESAKDLIVNPKIKVYWIKRELDRLEYESWLTKSDLILLPYDSSVYAEGTSGIFVEAIMAGKIPVVTANTWMSYELERFGLNELIVNWDDVLILDTLSKIVTSSVVGEKVKLMRSHYIKYHTGRTFADVLESLNGRHCA